MTTETDHKRQQQAPEPSASLYVRVPVELHRQAKAEAALRGESLAALVERALRAELDRRAA